MTRKGIGVFLLLMLLAPCALAQTYTGSVAAGQEIAVCAEGDDVLSALYAQSGAVVAEGELIGLTRTQKVFAQTDGTVARIHTKEGEMAAGTVLEIMPAEKFRIYCTAEEAYDRASLLRSGETLYLSCTADGTHRAVAVVTQIDGDEYEALTIGGELYTGETVYLYRSPDFEREARVGIGTVVENSVEAVSSEGYISRMHVEEGEQVQKGELLYELTQARSAEIASPVNGIVIGLGAQEGDRLSDGQTVALIAPLASLCVEFTLPEADAAGVRAGDPAWLSLASAPESAFAGTVTEISRLPDGDGYCVRILPDAEQEMRIGQSVTIELGE